MALPEVEGGRRRLHSQFSRGFKEFLHLISVMKESCFR